MYIGVQKGKKSEKKVSNSTLFDVRLRMSIIAQCTVYLGFVQMSEY
jgi:hypothetical protein